MNDSDTFNDRKLRNVNRSVDEDGSDRREKYGNGNKKSGDNRRRDTNSDKRTDGEDDIDMKRGGIRGVRGNEEDGNDRRNKERYGDRRRRGRSDDDDGSKMKKSENMTIGDGDGENRKTGKKHEDKSDEEDGEIRKRVRKGKHQDRSDEEDVEIKKTVRKGKHDNRSDGEDNKYKRKRDRKKDTSDDEDDKYKSRDRNKDGSRRDEKRDSRRSDDMAKHRSDKNGDKENLDEGPRFQKVAEMQEGMTNLGKSGGVYIPPFKLARMMSEVEDKSSMEYQRMTWDALRKSINGLVNKVNATNIKNIIPELLAENLIRGRGLFCRSCMKSQMASPGFTDVFAALVAVVNTKFPEVGDILLRRILLQLQRAYKRNDKHQLLAAVKFIAHLVNQQVVDDLIALELMTLLLENPTDSVEVAVGFVTECGSTLHDLSPKGLHGELIY